MRKSDIEMPYLQPSQHFLSFVNMFYLHFCNNFDVEHSDTYFTNTHSLAWFNEIKIYIQHDALTINQQNAYIQHC